MFQLFSDICCKCFYLNVTYVAVATHMLQAYVPNVLSVLGLRCSKSFVLQVFHEGWSPRGGRAPRGAVGQVDAGAQHGASEQQGTGKQQQGEQGVTSSRAGMHAPMHIREWGQPEGARGRQPHDVGPVTEVGALELCRFPSHFGR
jgi:hypothetical protein